MVDREKLIELLAGKCMETCIERKGHICSSGFCENNKEKCTGFYADHLIANGVTFATDNNVGRWIPVTERLPKEDERVLVWLGSGEITYTQIDTDRLHKGKWRRWSKQVTHWMPLPEPPKE